MTTSVLIMAGGTGGHVFPALTVAERLRSAGFDVQWLGAQQGIENRLVPAHGYPLYVLNIAGVRGNGVVRKLIAPLRLLAAVLAARGVIARTKPAISIGFGGFASGPGGLASVVSGVPLVIHEQNAVPGLTNRVLARLARVVLQAFAGAFKGNAITVGNPVRPEIAALPEPALRYATHEGALRILVTGGSQGALALNRTLPAELARVLAGTPADIRHQAGRGRVEEAAQAYADAGLAVQIDEFIDDMAAAYGWADLVICRAGAATVSEVAAAGVAALFIPLPTAVDDHQTWNARWLSDHQAALLLPQHALEQGGLPGVLKNHLHRDALVALAGAARARAIIDSADKVAAICQEVIHGR